MITQPIFFGVECWSAWAPGLSSARDWEEWGRVPYGISDKAGPQVKYLDSGLRRRASQLSRMSIEVAYRCLRGCDPQQVYFVFSSRHGETRTSESLLTTLVKGETLSPMSFSLSVHSTPAGLFSISAGNRRSYSAVAGNRESFCYGLLEALGVLKAHPSDKVLLVVADELVAQSLVDQVDEPALPYAFGMILSTSGKGVKMEFGLEPLAATESKKSPSDFPQALYFIRWLLSEREEFAITGRTQRWRFSRTGLAGGALFVSEYAKGA